MELPDYSTLLENELDEIWESQSRGETVLIDGIQQTKPVLGTADSISPQSSPRDFEIKVSALTLWHELEQCEVPVSNRDLLSFVHSDLKEFGLQATAGYLQIGQASLRKGRASFLSTIGFRREAPPKYICLGFDNVTRTSSHVIFRGKCYENV